MYSHRKPLKKEEETCFFFFFYCAPSSQAGLFQTGAFLRGSSVGPWVKAPGPRGQKGRGRRKAAPPDHPQLLCKVLKSTSSLSCSNR